jgi:hypothetical protein
MGQFAQGSRPSGTRDKLSEILCKVELVASPFHSAPFIALKVRPWFDAKVLAVCAEDIVLSCSKLQISKLVGDWVMEQTEETNLEKKIDELRAAVLDLQKLAKLREELRFYLCSYMSCTWESCSPPATKFLTK